MLSRELREIVDPIQRQRIARAMADIEGRLFDRGFTL
jgi:hypothetical protein